MELSAKQKIVLATIECIEKEGINAVTIRSIGREANVNSAAINYYFGSKDKLIDEAFDHIQKDMMMDFAEIINKNEDVRKTIEDLLFYMLQGIVRYPNISRAIFYEAFINGKYDSVFVAKLNSMCQGIFNKVSKQEGASLEDSNKIATVQLIASSLFIGIFPRMFNNFLTIDFKDEETLKRYVEKAADTFINAIS
jgi:AcrR family transcriptional regulator